jgi:hypothetical protein
MRAATPPTKKKSIVAARYIIPSRLWSSVKSHDFSPLWAA